MEFDRSETRNDLSETKEIQYLILMTTQTDNPDNSEVPAETINATSRRAILVLLLAVSLISICAIIYEIIIAAVSSYLLGNSVYQFSITIGLFMSSMGLGSFLSKFFDRYLVNRFILIEIIIGVLGGVSSIILFNAYIIVESTVGVSFGDVHPYHGNRDTCGLGNPDTDADCRPIRILAGHACERACF